MSNICFSVAKDCVNGEDSYGEICVHCNCCGRINKETMWQSRYETAVRHLQEKAEDFTDDFMKSNLQQRNIALNVKHYADKILEAVEHINFESEDLSNENN